MLGRTSRGRMTMQTKTINCPSADKLELSKFSSSELGLGKNVPTRVQVYDCYERAVVINRIVFSSNALAKWFSVSIVAVLDLA